MLRADDVTAVLLTGGRSTRMGRDKALIPVAGKPLLAHTLAGLSRVFRRILLSANEPAAYESFGLTLVPDVERQWGALAGIHAALLAAPTPWVFALAVDMPLVELAVIRLVLERATPDRAAVIPHGLGYHQPFCAVYGPRTLEILSPHAGRSFHIHQFATHPDVLHIPEDEVQQVSPSMHCFLNANTPDELREIERILLTSKDP